MPDRNIHTFIACDHEYRESDIVLFGAPFDGTTSNRPGTRFASAAIRADSINIETYSPYLDRDLLDIKVFDGGDLDFPFGNPARVLDMIEQYTTQTLENRKLPLMVGGEHLVTLGAVRAAIKQNPDLHILHFDAHADLRDDYLGEKLSHASVMRRCWELVGDGRIFQFGIRSGDRDEIYWGREHVTTNFFTLNGIKHALSVIGDKPVYLTIDLDVLDPSLFPGTGTPEAGGVTFTELHNALLKLQNLNIVAADVNELSPICDPTGASTAVATKLLRELMLILHSTRYQHG